MNNNNSEPITIGDFELNSNDLFSIVRLYIQGNSVNQISVQLDIDPEDLIELLNQPKVFEEALEARKLLIKLMVYGPLVDRLITIASRGTCETQIKAIKFLYKLIEDKSSEDKKKKGGSTNTNISHHTLNVIGQLPSGGFDSIVRQVEKVQEEKVIDVIPEIVNE